MHAKTNNINQFTSQQRKDYQIIASTIWKYTTRDCSVNTQPTNATALKTELIFIKRLEDTRDKVLIYTVRHWATV